MPWKRDTVNSPRRRVDHAPALHLPAANRERRHHVAVDEKHRTFASVLFVDSAVVRARIREVDRAIREEAVVGKDEQLVGNRRGKRIVRGANDDSAEQSLPYREPGTAIGMWVIPVGARASRDER